MIPSREEQRFRYERSVALSIEESLSALPGVLDARVHLNLPDDDPLFGDAARKGGSGSVLLVVEHGFAASDEEVSALVGGAAGLPREVVRVLKSKTVEGRALPSEESARAPVPPPQGASISPVVWPIAMTLVGGSALIGLGMRGGMRFLRARSKRRVKFELPKELDFEG
jgi:hypothetical protein